MGILFICGALAAGEFAASCAPSFAEAWPVAALLALGVALFGYGLRIRGWPLVAVFLLGAALFLAASVADEHLYREKPWMRGRARCELPGAVRERGLKDAVKADLSRRVGLGLAYDCEASALNRAILLGERARLPRRTKEVFVASGTMHVFAISGLHVMTIAGVLVYLLLAFLVPLPVAEVVTIPILWGYVYLIGFPPSAVRAALMATLCFLAPLFGRRPSLLRSWALTFLVVHVFRPLMIVNVGNALSFAVMLAIALAVEWERCCGLRVPAVWITVVAWAAGVPIGAHVFGRVAPGGILANLVLIATTECTVIFGAIGLIVSLASETLAAHFNNLSALCTRAMVGISELVSRIPGSSVDVPPWTLLQCAAWYVLLALIAFLVYSVRKRTF